MILCPENPEMHMRLRVVRTKLKDPTLDPKPYTPKPRNLYPESLPYTGSSKLLNPLSRKPQGLHPRA